LTEINQTSTSELAEAQSDLTAEQARLAYGIIESLLNHTDVIHDLIALMAQVLDQDTVKALTATPQWAAYLDSKRVLEHTQTEIQQFTEILQGLPDPAE
jgi:uncharacterized phage infection (PIP) family protein YhgE